MGRQAEEEHCSLLALNEGRSTPRPVVANPVVRSTAGEMARQVNGVDPDTVWPIAMANEVNHRQVS